MSSVALGGRGWTYYETVGGGSGAGPGFGGTSAVQCHMTNTLNTPAEAIELQYPLRVRRFECAPGTGGTGEFSGGDGAIREIEALAPCEGTLLGDRCLGHPYGLEHGSHGMPGENHIVKASGVTARLRGFERFTLEPGEVLSVRTPGGGGWGSTP